MRIYFFVLLALVSLASCAPKIYQTPDATLRARAQSIIAIAPPTVSISAQKNVDADALREQQNAESLTFQGEMYSWLLRRKQQGKIIAGIQDVATTNALLAEAGWPGRTLTPAEMMRVLQVDEMVTSNYRLSNPMSKGSAIALGVLTGVYGATDKASATLSIYDKENGEMIWNYDHSFSGSFTSPEQLVESLMKNASKKLPHIQK